ncbi:Uncharacterized protein FWK35_00016373 [Aphis craccivora]|uniref:Uncharacterized protein n=1 Tax=Aphis craccivora TaxID=307492 RepID=A0A6G0YK90_APHCR|nr:Uncharacterized protein FWK35_00016373 [Aphis craccivora]
MIICSCTLEAFPVNNGRAALVVFGLRNPHLLKSRQGRQDGATDPYGVLAFGRCDRFDFHRGRGE